MPTILRRVAYVIGQEADKIASVYWLGGDAFGDEHQDAVLSLILPCERKLPSGNTKVVMGLQRCRQIRSSRTQVYYH
jgi:hypothetical protein